jgi:hypothetical protein
MPLRAQSARLVFAHAFVLRSCVSGFFSSNFHVFFFFKKQALAIPHGRGFETKRSL